MNDKRIETDFEKIKDYLDIDTYYDELSEFKNLLYEVFGDRVESQKYIIRTNKKLEQLQSNWNSLREWLKKDDNVYICYSSQKSNKTFEAGVRFGLTFALDKMNELERNESNGK